MILYDDQDIVVVNKPTMLLSVPGKGPDKLDSVSYRLHQQFGEIHVCHRLDWKTSGLMVFAKNKTALRVLNKQFMERLVKKEYLCRVLGSLKGQGQIEVPMIVDWPNRPLQKIDFIEGKYALTQWKSIKIEPIKDKHSHKNYLVSRIHLTPATGRSHQLRLHMKYIGYPILGDTLYANDIALELSSRLELHASCLGFHHPRSYEWKDFQVSCPF
ncbi:MAG: RNA pseudouridine synthase [Gammaproteobacteria bacterium]|nr:RNA pseudouridine synthase [Gammaproteobacteria bacterium]